jgi:hypothetical protein
MTISEHDQSVSTFLQYDFVNGPSQGRILFVGKTNSGDPVLREVDVKNLKFSDKMFFFFSDGKKLETVVDYVSDHLIAEARSVKGKSPDKWKMQFAQLAKKVNTHNERHWLSVLSFDNPLVETLKIRVTIPNIPESFDEQKSYRKFTIKIPYSTLTTFQKVEEMVKKHIGPEGFYMDAESSDRQMLRDLAGRGQTIASWMNKNPDKKLNVFYTDINFKLYAQYVYEKAYAIGHYKGFSEGLYRFSGPHSRIKMMGYPELDDSKTISQEKLYEKYNSK